jgi:hypothetical protein
MNGSKSTEWRFHIAGKIRHVWPEDDSFEHNLEDDGYCVCCPRTEETGWGGTIVIHNSFDGRKTGATIVDE